MKVSTVLNQVKQFFDPVFGLKLVSARVEFDDKRQPAVLVLQFEEDGRPIKSLQISLKRNGVDTPVIHLEITSTRDEDGGGGGVMQCDVCGSLTAPAFSCSFLNSEVGWSTL